VQFYVGDEKYTVSYKGRDHLKYLRVDVRIILKYTLMKWGVRVRTGFIWLRIGPSGGSWNTAMNLRAF
jgi:hypothetical protein